MDRVLLINSGLKHSSIYVDPYLRKLKIFLEEEGNIVDVRNILSFDERTVFCYDVVIFLFLNTVDSIPSSTLEIFDKLESIELKEQLIYSIVLCDEYETEKCDISDKIVELWCKRRDIQYKGCLKIASVMVINKTIQRFPVTTMLKNASKTISNHQQLNSKITLLTLKNYLKVANKYWIKQAKKRQKEMKNI